MKVLVADDSKSIRTMIVRNLRQQGLDSATFLEAPDGDLALELVSAEHPALVICSWDLPKLSGVELFQKIDGTSIAFALVMPDHASEHRSTATGAGVRFLVYTPLTPDSFEDVLSTFESAR